MPVPIFLSYPRPHQVQQKKFTDDLSAYLRKRGLEPKTLGVNEYDLDAPLKAIRRLMMESNGLITVAFRRTWVKEGVLRKGADIAGANESPNDDIWLTSPYCHIEPAMAYQLGLPILLLREKGVIADGALEKGVLGLYMPEFSLEDSMQDYLQSPEWIAMVTKWEGHVRAVVDSKGNPPKLY